LLREELNKVNPSLASVTAFRKAAYGDESVGETELGAERLLTKEVPIEEEGSLSSALPKSTESEVRIEEDEPGFEAE